MPEESPYWNCFRSMRFRVSWRKWQYLPRHPAYKYEYFDGQAQLTPRPKPVDMLLDLEKWKGPKPLGSSDFQSHNMVRIRQITDADWPALIETFYFAFVSEEPFKSLSSHHAKRAARECLEFTRKGGDEKLIDGACLLAEQVAADKPNLILGAALIADIRPPHLMEKLRAIAPDLASVPHLTWLFVNRLRARHGIGTFLLDRVVGALRSMGRSHLASTTSLGSDASLLWHWKNGFTLLDRGFSVRVGVEDAKPSLENPAEENQV
jgi:GNAT superfamily N-acetyltransferase